MKLEAKRMYCHTCKNPCNLVQLLMSMDTISVKRRNMHRNIPNYIKKGTQIHIRVLNFNFMAHECEGYFCCFTLLHTCCFYLFIFCLLEGSLK